MVEDIAQWLDRLGLAKCVLRRQGYALSARNDHWQSFLSENQPDKGAHRDLPSQYRAGLTPRRPSCYVFRQPPGDLGNLG